MQLYKKVASLINFNTNKKADNKRGLCASFFIIGVIAGITAGVIFAANQGYIKPAFALVDLWIESGANIYNANTGNVGIGTVNPLGKLHIADGNLLVTGQASGIDSNTKLMLHADETGASFTDSSPSAHTVTANGNATQSATQSKFGGKSAYFDGTGDCLTLNNPSDFTFSGDFTIDFWVNFNSTASQMYLIGNNKTASRTWWTRFQSNFLFFDSNIGGGSAAWTPSTGAWYHVAIVRTGNTLKFFINGTQIGTDVSITGSMSDGTDTFEVGGGYSTGCSIPLNGYMDEVRISRGIARWTANFTPPTAPYGGSAGGNVGIGTTAPAQKLDVSGTIQMMGFKMPTGATSGYVLTSDASGVGTWQAAAGGGASGWADDGAVVRLTANTDNVGIGTANPSAKLEVQGGPIKAGGGLIIEVRTSDPLSPVTGQMWLISQ